MKKKINFNLLEPFYNDGKIFSPLRANVNSSLVPLENLYINTGDISSIISAIRRELGDVMSFVNKDVFKIVFEYLNTPLRQINTKEGGNIFQSSPYDLYEGMVIYDGIRSYYLGENDIFSVGPFMTSFSKIINNLEYQRTFGKQSRDSRSIIPIYIVCINKEHVRYVKQCIVLGKEIHPEVLKIMIHNNISNPAFMDPILVENLTRDVFSKFSSSNTIMTEDFSEMFTKVTKPKVSGIDGLEGEFEKISNEFLDFVKNGKSKNMTIGDGFELIIT